MRAMYGEVEYMLTVVDDENEENEDDESDHGDSETNDANIRCRMRTITQ